MDAKKTIGVFFGSRSPEHDVSIITGQLICAGLKQLGHSVVPIYIDKEGDWFIGEKLGDISFFRSSERNFSGTEGYNLNLQASKGKLVFIKAGLLGKRRIEIDMAFPALHGQMGEDGTIQGLFEMLNVPYVGCDVTASAVTMDKVLTKERYASHGIPTTPYMPLEKSDWENDREQIIRRIESALTYPMFVKPARLGSSIGIEKVSERADLERAIEVALNYDSKALVEDGVEPLVDITVAVLGNENPRPSLLQESLFTDQLFSYDEKYLKQGGAQLGKAEQSIVIPARLDPETTATIQGMATEIYKLFECSGIARVDFLVNADTKEIFANEINPLPGTLYHHLWRASGVSLHELLTELLDFADARHRAKGEVTMTFDSEILSQATSSKAKLNLNED